MINKRHINTIIVSVVLAVVAASCSGSPATTAASTTTAAPTTMAPTVTTAAPTTMAPTVTTAAPTSATAAAAREAFTSVGAAALVDPLSDVELDSLGTGACAAAAAAPDMATLVSIISAATAGKYTTEQIQAATPVLLAVYCPDTSAKLGA